MKKKIKSLILKALQKAYEEGSFPSDSFPEIELDEPKAEAHGDLSANIAMKMAAIQKMPPRKIAEILISAIDDVEGLLVKTEIAGPGFINFFIKPSAWIPILSGIHGQGMSYGSCDMGRGKRIQVEFVSANPTGPLHVGHGRGAAVGDAMGDILSFCGYDVQKEYYINDSGRQIRTLGLSVFLRYQEIQGRIATFPEDCYQGDYIFEIAREIKEEKGESLFSMEEEEAVLHCARYAAGKILAGIRADLSGFGVDFDVWFSEQTLYDRGWVQKALDDLKERGIVYEKDGALWFKTTDYEDEKDRVVVRQNGLTTYFASDIAYHMDKYERGFDKVIDVWGADHHGYIPRMMAAIQATGREKERFSVILVQLVNLLRGGVPVQMSTRSGEFVTLEDVVREVGKDAARFIFLTRHYESPLDFDLELAKEKTSDNPVYYVQYVHARISSIIEKAKERGYPEILETREAMEKITNHDDVVLMKNLARYPEVVKNSAKFMEPHRITYYLMDLSSSFHSYYNKNRVLGEDPAQSQGRLYLVSAVASVIRNGLSLLGVSAPEKM